MSDDVECQGGAVENRLSTAAFYGFSGTSQDVMGCPKSPEKAFRLPAAQDDFQESVPDASFHGCKGSK